MFTANTHVAYKLWTRYEGITTSRRAFGEGFKDGLRGYCCISGRRSRGATGKVLGGAGSGVDGLEGNVGEGGVGDNWRGGKRMTIVGMRRWISINEVKRPCIYHYPLHPTLISLLPP